MELKRTSISPLRVIAMLTGILGALGGVVQLVAVLWFGGQVLLVEGQALEILRGSVDMLGRDALGAICGVLGLVLGLFLLLVGLLLLLIVVGWAALLGSAVAGSLRGHPLTLAGASAANLVAAVPWFVAFDGNRDRYELAALGVGAILSALACGLAAGLHHAATPPPTTTAP